MTAAGVLTYRGATSGPDTPQEAAEAFMSAGLRHDWRASWELLCRSEQLEHGSVDRYVMVKQGAAALVGWSEPGGATVSVGEARPHTRIESRAWLVDVQLARAGEIHDMQLVVVEEAGGPRACGQR